MPPKVVVKAGDITREQVDAIVNPANSFGSMGGGCAYAIKKAGGSEIEAEAISKGPTPVGLAVETSAGRLPARYVIHAPTMENPAESIDKDNVRAATYAALRKAKDMGIRSLAFPGMGTGIGGVPKKEAAAAMLAEIKRFAAEEKSLLESIVLVAFDKELENAFGVSLKDAGI
jgi:O-acetyl-ADP-ribose deacetylase (regulator of RNase III)